MVAMRKLGAALLLGAGVFVVGSGLAAIDVWPGDACVGGETSLVPYGSVCTSMYDGSPEVYRPSTVEFVAWLVGTAAIFALVLRFRAAPFARGVAAAAVALALYALVSHQIAGLAGLMSAPYFALPVYALDRTLVRAEHAWVQALQALAISVAAVFVGSLPWYFDAAEAGVPLGLALGGLLAVGIERLSSSRRAASR